MALNLFCDKTLQISYTFIPVLESGTVQSALTERVLKMEVDADGQFCPNLAKGSK